MQPANPVGGLDSYELRHLVDHLATAGRDDQVHRLLALEWEDHRSEPAADGSRRNAWYDAKRAAGEEQSYAADLDVGWRLADERFVRTHAAAAMGLQASYALITTSLTSAASALTPDLLADLMRRQIWPLSQALDAALRMRPEARRDEALAQLAAEAGDERPGDLLQAVLAIADEEAKARALIAITPNLPAELTASILDASRDFSDDGLRARTLTAVAARLPDDRIADALRDALQLREERARATVLAVIAPRLTAPLADAALDAARTLTDEAARLELLTALGGSLSPRGAARAKRLLQRSPPSPERARATAAVAGALSVTARARALHAERAAIASIAAPHAQALALAHIGEVDQAVRVARRADDEIERAQALTGVAAHLSDAGLREALAAVGDVTNERERVEALARLAPHLPASSMLTALKLASRARTADARATGLQALAAFLPEERLVRAAREALALKDVDRRAEMLAALAPRLRGPIVLRVLRVANRSRAPGGRAALLRAIAPAVRTKEELVYARRLADRLPEDVRADILSALTHSTTEELTQLTAAISIGDDDAVQSFLAAVLSAPPEGDLADQGDDDYEILRGLAAEPRAATATNGSAADRPPRNAFLRRRLAAAIDDRHVDLRVQELAQALAVVDDADRRTALHLALALAENGAGPSVAEVVPHFAAYGRLREALAAAREITDKYRRAEALAALAGGVDDGVRAQVVDECLSLLRSVLKSGAPEPWDEDLAVLDPLLPHLDRGRLDRTVRLIARAERSVRPEGVPPDRVRVVACRAQVRLATSLPDRRRELVLGDVLNTAMRIRSSAGQALVLDDLGPLLTRQLISDALDFAGAIDAEPSRADALRTLAPLLEVPLLEPAIACGREIHSEPARSRALVALAERLLDVGLERDAVELAAEIATNAGDVETADARTQALSQLSSVLTRLEPDDCGAIWCASPGSGLLRRIARSSRRDLLTDLTQLAPTIRRLGGSDTGDALAAAVGDAVRWWP